MATSSVRPSQRPELTPTPSAPGRTVPAVAQGLTAKEIARAFDIAPGTVVKRLACAMFKLGVHRQGAMVAEAMRRQIITPQAHSPKVDTCKM